MSTATLNDLSVTRLRVQIPAWGIWWADVEIGEPVELSGAVVLRVSDLELRGVVAGGGPYLGAARYRIAGGAGGWGREIAEKSYANDAGVKRSLVISDAVTAAGETIDVDTIPTGTIGSAWTRRADAASAVLHLLAPRAWYVGEDGVTRIGARETRELTAEAARLGPVDEARGVIDLAADQVAELVPGVVVDGLEAVDVEHKLEDRKLRTRIWGAGRSDTSRLVESERRKIRALLPELPFRGLTEYRIATQDGERLNLQAPRASLGMPDLRRVRVRPGLPGCRAEHALGSMVLVAFVNADPSRPVVVAFDDAEAPGFPPDRIDLGGEDDTGVDPLDAVGRVVRYGDPITFASPGPGTIVAPAPASLSRVRA